MFPTFISILDIQSWWEVPSIAHFCSLFRGSFNLLDFDIEDLEEALLSDGTEESSWLQDLIVRLLSGCLASNEISTFNYQMFLRRLFRQKCQETNRFNPFNTDIDFQFLPLRTKVQILHALCDFRLDADDVLDNLKNLEADSLRVEPLGHDENCSAYWYFYGTRLYREDYLNGNKNRKTGKSIWQVICFTEDDWHHLAKKFKTSSVKTERKLYRVLKENFLPDLPRLFHEKEVLHRKRLLEWLPRRTSTRLDVKKQQIKEPSEEIENQPETSEKETEKEKSRKKRKSFEKSKKRKDDSDDSKKRKTEDKRHVEEMADRRKQRELRALNREKSKSRSRTESDTDSIVSRATTPALTSSSSLGVGRQTNNSLASATGDQIVIQSVSNPNRKKLKTSQVFRQSDEDLQTGMYKILENVKNHEDAWPFVDPVEEEYAPNYYSIIRKPMDLQRMEDKLDAGEYLTFSRFKADFQLIVDNCRLYNGSDNEYTEMVDNLQQIFQRATDRYLDQISSSDEEIAVEFQESSRDSKAQSSSSNSQTTATKRKKQEPQPTGQKRKSTSTSQQPEKRRSLERSPSVASSKKSESLDSTEKVKNEKKTRGKAQTTAKNAKTKVVNKTEVKIVKGNKKSKKSKSPSPVLRNKSPSWPPTSPEHKEESESELEHVSKVKEKRKHWKEVFKDKKNNKKNEEVKVEKEVLKPKEDNKPKDKNVKLRETIEKLKEKNNLSEESAPKNNKTKEEKKEKKVIKEEKEVEKLEKPKKLLGNKASKLKTVTKEPVKQSTKKCEFDFEEFSDKEDSISDKKSNKKQVKKTITVKNVADIDALDAATEQTLKDINKWLDDTPRFSEFSSASNSPSHFIGAEETDAVGAKIEQEYRKNLKMDKPRGKDGQKDMFKRRLAQLKDPSKVPRRREVQRTIERLQPGKSKGNLLSNMQNANKPEELFPLGPLSKLRDSKNSLVTKTDDAAPKLSLGTVLDSFGQHNFSEEAEKIPKELEESSPKEENSNDAVPKTEVVSEVSKTEEDVPKKEEVVEKPVVVPPKKEVKNASATPNLSAWFKAFGAPKVQPTQKKKPENDPETKESEVAVANPEPKSVPEAKPAEEPRKVVSPEPDSPAGLGQPTRQRRGSTGSSMSERSSFSQDMDSSPRMSMDERLGAYPAPYPSPLHRSPVSASPIMASPRQEEAPRAPYPALNGSIRVGFYQDTVSTKSSPDKSCSPRDQPHSPYQQYPEHVYTPPNTLQQGGNYPYTPNPYYTQQPPSYASTNPPPAYSERSSTSAYYDTTKPLTDQYNAKVPTPTTYPTEENPLSPEPREFKSNPTENAESFRPRSLEKQTTMFPVKKRLYSETDTNSGANNATPREEQESQAPENREFANRSLEHGLMTGRQLNLGITTQQLSPDLQTSPREKQFQENRETENTNYSRPESRDLNLAINKTFDSMKMYNSQVDISQQRDMDMQIPHSQTVPTNMRMTFSQGSQEVLNSFDTMNRNIDTTRQESTERNKFDVKLGMGYLNSGNVDLTRTSQYQSINYPKPSKPEVSNAETTVSGSEHINLSMRYPDSRVMSHSMAYPTRSEAQTMAMSNSDMLQMGQNTRAQSIPNRNLGVDMTGNNYKPSDMTIPRPGFNSSPTLGMNQSLGIRGNLADLTHIVDRFPTEDRLLSGLQNSSYYADKGLSHMFAKTIPTTLHTSNASTSSLPMFSQPMAYRGDIQQSNMAYTRPITELQNPQSIIPQSKSPVSQTDSKKARKRKTKQSPVNEVAVSSAPQGFQSYAGLKNTVSGEPSAISLKTASVVPGSAFNFGPTGPGLGLSTWSVSDKDAYSGFLDEYRPPTNYFLAAAQRSTPENTGEKPVRQAHQQNTAPTPSFPFLGHPQPRAPGYPIGNPFMNPHQAPLMDPNSPLYQQYLHSAGVLHQGLLSPPTGYPPGYHPALSMRQPYDSMTRPSWL